MKPQLVICAAVATCCSTAANAQENWAGAPVPASTGSSGVVRGGEYIAAECNLRFPAPFKCTNNPREVGEVFIPISSFARSSTVEVLESTVTGLQGRVAGVEAQVLGLDVTISDLATKLSSARREARQGIAAAVAIGNAGMPSAPGRTSYDFNLATFQGREAIGGSLKYRLNTEEPVAISFGVSAAGSGNTAARVGISGEF